MSEQKVLYLQEAKGSFVVSNGPIPKPGPGQLLVKVISAALNPVDWKLQAFLTFIPGMKYPAILGIDFSGDVAEIGEGVEGFSKGEKIFCQGYFVNEMAGFQQYAIIPADIVGKIPSNIDYAQASTIPLGFITAAVGIMASTGAALDPSFELKANYSGESAIVVGGSTSVGQFAIQILRLLKFGSIITYASGRHTDFLKSLGATHVFDRGEIPVGSLAEAAKKIARSPISIAFNAVGDDDSKNACIDALAEDGQLADVNPEVKDVGSGKKIHPIVGSSHFPPNRDFGRYLWKALPRLVQDEMIVPNRVEKLPNGLAGIDEGLQKMKANKVSGVKLVAFPQETA